MRHLQARQMSNPVARFSSSLPHVGQELLQLLLAVQRPQLEVTRRVTGVTDALIQRPVLVEGQTQAGADG